MGSDLRRLVMDTGLHRLMMRYVEPNKIWEDYYRNARELNVPKVDRLDAHALLKDAGFNLLGSGAYAIAIEHPINPDLVIKIGLGGGHSGDLVDGWLDYAAFCVSHPDAPHTPKLHDIFLHQRGYYALMPRYTYIGEKWDDFCEYGRLQFYRALRGETIHTPSSFSQLGLLLNQAGYNTNSLDLHDENVMVDSTGEIIITDPFCGKPSGDTSSFEILELEIAA